MFDIIPGENYYLLQCHHVRRRSVTEHAETHRSLEDHEHVAEAEQQQVKSRRRRLWGFGGNQFGGGRMFQQQQQPG